MSLDNEDPKRKKQSGIHKWLVFLSAYVAVAVTLGFNFTIGTLFRAIMEEFEATRAQTALMQSTLYTVFFGSGVVAGPLVRKYGPRKAGLVGSVCSSLGIMASYFASSITFLIICISAFAGFGFSMVYISVNTSVEKQFEGKRKIFILSILPSAASIGGMLYPYLMAYLNDVYGVRGALLLVGIIIAHTIPSSLLWTNEEAAVCNTKINNNVDANIHCTEFDKNASIVFGRLSGSSSLDNFAEFGRTIRISERLRGDDGVRNSRFNVVYNTTNTDNTDTTLTAGESVIHLIKNKTFVIFMMALSVSFPTFTFPLVFIVDIFVDKGGTETYAHLGLLIMGIISLFGRMCPGFIVQIPKFPIIGITIIFSLVAALGFLGVILLRTVGAIIASFAVVAFCYGTFFTMMTVVPVRLVERENLPTATGLLFTSCGLTIAILGPVAGLLRDRTNSYDVSLYLAVGCLVLAAGIFTLAHITRRQAKMEMKKEKRTSVFYVTKF